MFLPKMLCQNKEFVNQRQNCIYLVHNSFVLGCKCPIALPLATLLIGLVLQDFILVFHFRVLMVPLEGVVKHFVTKVIKL